MSIWYFFYVHKHSLQSCSILSVCPVILSRLLQSICSYLTLQKQSATSREKRGHSWEGNQIALHTQQQSCRFVGPRMSSPGEGLSRSPLSAQTHPLPVPGGLRCSECMLCEQLHLQTSDSKLQADTTTNNGLMCSVMVAAAHFCMHQRLQLYQEGRPNMARGYDIMHTMLRKLKQGCACPLKALDPADVQAALWGGSR